MKIIKKDGRIEEFLDRKIRTSLENTAKDAGVSLNNADLQILVQDVIARINKIRKLTNTPTSSYEVKGIVIAILKEDKFTKIAEAYIK